MLILFGLLLKVIFDFKVMGGFNYPLLIKILNMIITLKNNLNKLKLNNIVKKI